MRWPEISPLHVDNLHQSRKFIETSIFIPFIISNNLQPLLKLHTLTISPDSGKSPCHFGIAWAFSTYAAFVPVPKITAANTSLFVYRPPANVPTVSLTYSKNAEHVSPESTNKLIIILQKNLTKNAITWLKIQLPELLCAYLDLVFQWHFSIQPQHPDQPV